MGTGGRGVRGEGAAPPSSASRHGDADSAAPNAMTPAQKAEWRQTLGQLHAVPDIEPRSREEQLAALEAMAEEQP
jgi:hypothetical protein